MARQQESKLSDKALRLLRTLPNSWWLKKEAMAIRGIPDLLGCVNGFFIAIELKRSTAKKDKSRESLQEYVCSKIVDAGGISYERVTELNLTEVYEDIKEKCWLPEGLPDPDEELH